MTKKTPNTTKVPLALQRADELDAAKFAKDAAGAAIRMIEEARARRGLPPLLP